MTAFPHLRVLVVDDALETRTAIRKALPGDETLRYEFVEAETGQEALILNSRDPGRIDLGFLSRNLRDLTESEVMARLRDGEELPPFPIILIHDGPPPAIALDGMHPGIQDVVRRDALAQENLPHLVRNALDRFRLTRRLVRCEQKMRQARLGTGDFGRAKSTFLSSMSHELRTPLTAVVGLAELLLENPATPDSPHMLEMIRSNGLHLTDLLNDILDLARIESGTVEVEIAPCDPLLLIRELCDLLRGRAQDKGLTLELVFEGELPARMQTDTARFRRILMKLLTNAIKYTGHGGIQVGVCFERGPTPMLHVTVEDTGMGIGGGDLEAIFEPFVPISEDHDSRKHGAGLGLAIGRSLARSLGGDLTVRSQRGLGSEFKLTIRGEGATALARYDPRTYAAPPREEAPHRDLPEGCWADRSLLIAEDTPANQFLLRRMLETTGARLTFVENGEQAVTAVCRSIDASQPFDLILMDIQMPGMNGFDATRAIRREGVDRPIIALTAAAMEGDRELCLQAGCSDYLSKPINRHALLELIADSLPDA